ncbi:MAG: HAMP domain-containing sensor histidine kinase [Chitinophagaceae bacterium]
MRQYLNWKTYLILVALAIVSATLLYTSALSKRLAKEERRNVEQFAKAVQFLATASQNQDLSFAFAIVDSNTTIPIFRAGGFDSILDYKNIDTTGVKDVHKFLQRKLARFKQEHVGIVVNYGTGLEYIYYGDSFLLRQLTFFPYVELGIILLFLVVVLIAISSAHRSIQNQVWVGLSKETAHQLGTPLSALTGWLELLKGNKENEEAVAEMEKDLNRLMLVADRFGKVGSEPQLHQENLTERLRQIVDYMQKRAPRKVIISLHAPEQELLVAISSTLFDWVIENLIRNALDAMEGQGRIDVKVATTPSQVIVDVSDTGKGIPRHQLSKVFTPGFSTKKRGWGLGLSLSRRIIRQYHHGSLTVHQSEIGKGTTFRVVLRR